jgi:Arc/MetJ family transcription regulator
MFSNRYASPVEQPRRYEKLMKETLRLAGMKTKREAIELGLRTIVRLQTNRKTSAGFAASFHGGVTWMR